MRFRGTFARESLGVLLDLSQCFSRLAGTSPQCAFTLTPERFEIALKCANDELQCFAKLQPERLFQQVVIQSRADNQIGFLCDIRLFHQAISSGKEGAGFMMRLLKRDNRSFLCLRTRAVDIDIVQSIPIQVLSMTSFDHYAEPNIAAPEIALELPPVRALRNIVDRLRAMHKSVTIQANRRGNLTLLIESSTVTVQTLVANLKVRQDLLPAAAPDQGEHTSEEDQAFRVTVDAKSLSRAISMDGNTTENLFCCISQGQAFVLHCVLMDNFGAFTCYLPVLMMDTV